MEENITNKKTGTIPLIFMVIGLLFCILFAFTGLMYVFSNSYLCAFLSLIVLLLVFFSDRLEKKKIKTNYSNNAQEITLKFLYLIIAILIFPFISHFIYLNLNKNDIIGNGNKKIEAVNKLISDYETKVNDYTIFIDSKIRTAYLNSLSDSTNNTHYADTLFEYLESKVDISKADIEALISSKNIVIYHKYMAKFDSLKTIFNNKCDSDYYPVFKLSLILDINISEYYNYIIEDYDTLYSTAIMKMPAFASIYKKPPESDNLRLNIPFYSIFNSNSSHFNIIIILLVLVILNGVLHFCILLPYLAASRPPKIPSLDDKGGSLKTAEPEKSKKR